MDEPFETLSAQVRVDTQGFCRDVEAMRASLEGSLGDGATRAGRTIEASLLRAVRTGKLGFGIASGYDDSYHLTPARLLRNALQLGWEPPSTLLSPAHDGAMAYLRQVMAAFVAIGAAAGLEAKVQVGEP